MESGAEMLCFPSLFFCTKKSGVKKREFDEIFPKLFYGIFKFISALAPFTTACGGDPPSLKAASRCPGKMSFRHASYEMTEGFERTDIYSKRHFYLPIVELLKEWSVESEEWSCLIQKIDFVSEIALNSDFIKNLDCNNSTLNS